MLELLSNIPELATLASHATHGHGAEGAAAGAAEAAHAVGAAIAGSGNKLFLLIPLLPLLSMALCGLYWAFGVKSKLPAWTTVGLLGASFGLTILAYFEIAAPGVTQIVHGFRWIGIDLSPHQEGGLELIANFGLYLDSLTILWMLFVTGLATLIALYASEYMAHDVGPGYCRFFFAFSLFVFAMSALVMGDNLLMLYLGWEGVGLCSYLLIGYFFTKPSAVAAAKKAFIMNRIGDLGLAIGIMMTFVQFGTIEYAGIFEQVDAIRASGGELPFAVKAIPLLLMVGAFGKSAQLPLYTWLPDAMEGPTPVSALIHAATMVTAGVYLIARTYPLYTLNPTALVIVAWVGGLTALLAATIGMAQYDIKRIMAYSTVSQLGYMFLGLGVLSSAGAAFHVFTHAFFKATLFLCCGAVMHGFAGQLDLRKLSGVWGMKGWRIVSVAMLIGCLNLAGFPLTAGYFSKDMILAEAFVTPGFAVLGWIALITAGLTAYYTFRVWFRVFMGPGEFEPGDEHHGDAEDEMTAEDGHDNHAGHGGHGGSSFHPHPPKWAINTVLAILAVGSLAVVGVYFIDTEHHGWVGGLVHDSTAHYESPFVHHGAAAHEIAGAHGAEASGAELAPGTFLGFDPHEALFFASGIIGAIGILIAAFLHGPTGFGGLFIGARTEAATSRADGLKRTFAPVGKWAERKWYVDELYDFLFRIPLWVLAHICYLFDRFIIDGIVDGLAKTPRGVGSGLRPSQNGLLQSYAVGMAGGLAFILLVIWVVL